MIAFAISLALGGASPEALAANGLPTPRPAWEPPLTRLTGADIVHLLRDRSVEPARGVPQMTASYTEAFFRSGAWTTTRLSRAATAFPGSWTVDHDRLCITSAAVGASCRPVWRDRRGRLVMADPMSPWSRPIPLVLSIYKLRPLTPP